jgi:hypothetical protein
VSDISEALNSNTAFLKGSRYVRLKQGVEWGGSEERWTERNGSILTTLEPGAIMTPGDLAA